MTFDGPTKNEKNEKNEMDSIQNERSSVININWDNLFRNQP